LWVRGSEDKICLVVKAYKRHGSLDTFSSGALSTGQFLKIEKFYGSGSMDVSEIVKYLPAKDRSAFIFRGK
jgi:hypothetical protein